MLALALAAAFLTTLATPLVPFADATHGMVHAEQRALWPAAPFREAAAWVGGVFHVTFGQSQFAYDPVSDAWSTLPGPAEWQSNVAGASFGGKFYVVGGDATGSTYDCVDTARGSQCRTLVAYEPVSRTWTRLADMPTPRSQLGAAFLGGLLYAVGGEGDDAAASAVEVYNPATNRWTSLLPLPEPRRDGTSLTAFAGKLWLVGGTTITPENPYAGGTRTTYVFDPAVNVWVRVQDYPYDVSDLSLGECAGKLFAFGGTRWDGPTWPPNPRIHVYDPTLGWQDAGPSRDAQGFMVLSDVRGGALTLGDLTMAVSTGGADAWRCPVGIGPWGTGPEILVEDVDLLPANAAQGDTIALSATVRNRGNAPTGAFDVSFRDGTAVVGSVAVATLASGESVTVQSPTFVAVGGPRAFAAWADTLNAVPEWNEDNNVREETIRVRSPDLAPVSVAFSPPDANPGELVQLVAVVRNIGDSGADASSTGFMVDYASIGSVATPSLAVGESATVTSAEFALPPNPVWVHVTADDADAIVEDIEYNNVLAQEIRPTVVDLRTLALTVTPAAPASGDAVTFTATVHNGGTRPAGSFVVRFTLDAGATLVGDVVVPALAAGATTSVVSPAWTATGASHVVRATADALGEIPESNENNNARDTPFTIALRNIVAQNLETLPASPVHGDVVTFRATVRNAGATSVGATVARFSLDGAPLASFDVPPLAAGAVATFEASAALTGGDHAVAFEVDVGGVVPESNEADNAATLAVRVRQADLVVDRVAPSVETPHPGKSVTFSADVRNAGDAPAGPFTVQVSLEGEVIGTFDVPSLAPGETVALTTTSVHLTKPGPRTVRAIADATSAVDEANETNNERVTTFTVAP